jgi:hypothetical protein
VCSTYSTQPLIELLGCAVPACGLATKVTMRAHPSSLTVKGISMTMRPSVGVCPLCFSMTGEGGTIVSVITDNR